jgi:hypothetical protein
VVTELPLLQAISPQERRLFLLELDELFRQLDPPSFAAFD